MNTGGAEVARINTGKPTEKELEILRVLWDRGPSTVREVNDEISRGQATGYTTTLKIMQIMTEKGLVARDESSRTHVYVASVTERETQGLLVRDLADRAFAGSAEKLVVRALAARTVSAEELAAIRRMLDEIEKGAKK